MENRHVKVLYGGTQLTFMHLMESHWVITARRVIKSTIHRCLPFTRFPATTMYQRMGNLPPSRNKPSDPFSYVGVDYAGSINIWTTPRRDTRRKDILSFLYACAPKQYI